MNDRTERDRLERLQVEAKALEARLAQVRPALRPIKGELEAAEYRRQVAQVDVWHLRTENARLAEELRQRAEPARGAFSEVVGFVVCSLCLAWLVISVLLR
jgi:hypothetical protein